MSKAWYTRDTFFHYPKRVYDSRGTLSSQVAYLQSIDKLDTAYINKQYSTRPKVAVRDLVSSMSTRLLANGYQGTRGENSRLLLGAKGIGKSSTLISSCIALSTMHRDLIPVYLQYTHKNTPPPSTAIVKNLEERDILSQEQREIVSKDVRKLTDLLCDSGLKVLLVVDEMDQLYEGKDDEGRRLSILDDLNYIASDPSGAYCTIGCGSSSYLPLLVTKNGIGNPYIEKNYPLLLNAPNLNGSKFPSFRLGIGLMSDDEYGEILEDKLGKKPTEEQIRLCRYLAGPNIRRIGQLVSSSDLVRDLEQTIVPYDAADSRALNIRDEIGPLITATYDKLIDKNFGLVKQINTHTGLKEILKLDWGLIEPINEDDITLIIRGVKEKGYQCDRRDYFRLIDTNWFLGNENLTQIYPHTPFHLICHRLEIRPRDIAVYARKIAEEAHRLLPSIARGIRI